MPHGAPSAHTGEAQRPAYSPSAQESIADDIELITQRIEAGCIDITAGYDNWRDLGFALTDALGESGRDYYHRISRFNSGYTESECDKQYDT